MSNLPSPSYEQLREAGVQHFRAGQLSAARQAFESARLAAQQNANPQGEAEMSNNLGMVCQKAKEYDAAYQHFDAAIHLLASIGDDVKRAQAMGNLGALLAEQGKYKEAEIRLEQAAEVFHKLRDSQNEALTLKWLSRIHMQHRDIFAAIFAYERALARLEPLPPHLSLFRKLLQIPLRMLNR
jgi:tetratricopeptide (TPR) repeat protein